MRIKIETDHLLLDTKLFEMLPEAWRGSLAQIPAQRRSERRAQLNYDGRTWQPDVTVQCLNVGFSFFKFPYRLERTRGTIELKQQQLKINLVAASDSAEVRVVGDFLLQPPVPSGWVEVRGENLRLDEKFFLALPPKPNEFVRSLNPYGTFNLYYRFWQGPPSRPEIHQYATMTLNRCSLKYAKFPYALDDLRGVIEMQDNCLELPRSGRRQRNRPCQLRWSVRRYACRGIHLLLRFHGQNVPMEDELRDALSPGATALERLKPRGTVNIDTEWRSRSRPTSNRTCGQGPTGRRRCLDRADLFLVPAGRNPGDFIFNDGKLIMDQVKGHTRRHRSAGPRPLRSAAGRRLEPCISTTCRSTGCGSSATWCRHLPTRLKKLATVLRLGRADELAGRTGNRQPRRGERADHIALESAGRPAPDQPGLGRPRRQHQRRPVDRRQFRRPAIPLPGRRQYRFVDVQGISVHGVDGPVLDRRYATPGRYLGRPCAAQPARTAHDQQDVRGHGAGRRLGDVPAGAALQLRGFAGRGRPGPADKEAIPGRQPLSGSILANVELRGKGSSLNDLGGRGTIQLRDADIYQLPLMVSLLKLLSVRQPDTTAFTRSDINFYIQGQHIYVDRIDFSGDAISLLGKGEVGFDKQIRLTFHAMVGRNENRMPVLKDVLGGASKQIMLIHAEGSLDQPALRREAFPGVNQALQQLQAEFQARDAVPRRVGEVGAATPSNYIPKN